jgi:hypothetical protein
MLTRPKILSGSFNCISIVLGIHVLLQINSINFAKTIHRLMLFIVLASSSCRCFLA